MLLFFPSSSPWIPRFRLAIGFYLSLPFHRSRRKILSPLAACHLPSNLPSHVCIYIYMSVLCATQRKRIWKKKKKLHEERIFWRERKSLILTTKRSFFKINLFVYRGKSHQRYYNFLIIIIINNNKFNQI